LISKILFKIKELQPEKTIAELKAYAEYEIRSESKMQLDYFEIVNAETLQSISNFLEVKSAVACIAITLGPIRLIDNVILTE
ncbi:MAG: pantoate--beta-alanine ligase, partial [Crocinitomicaceae bacterium]